MLACVDVDYRDDSAIAACLAFHSWQDAAPASELAVTVDHVAPYEPGQFYRRELPCILAAIAPLGAAGLAAIVVDGYVWLGDEDTPGLGAHLYAALDQRVPVIGVAKSPFAGATAAREVIRGGSRRPLYITAAGLDVVEAANSIHSMHGDHRLPTLLKRVDRLARESPL